MADYESVLLLASLTFGSAIWGRLVWKLISVHSRVARGSGVGFVAAALLPSIVLIALALRYLAASDVRSSGQYILMYLCLGLFVTGLNLVALRVFGFRPADISERGNGAAGIMLVGATLASALAYSGANIGDGPGVQVVIFCAALSHAALYALVVLHAALARSSYRILVDRDRGAALRFSCLAIACGIVLGRAVAGNWIGIGATLADFASLAWIAAVLVVADAIVARATLSREPGGSMPADLAIGVGHLAVAIGFVASKGMPA